MKEKYYNEKKIIEEGSIEVAFFKGLGNKILQLSFGTGREISGELFQ